MKYFLAILILLLTLAVPFSAHAQDPNPLAWALALTPKDYPSLSEKDLARAADELWNWSYLGPKAPVAGTTEERNAAMSKSRDIAKVLLRKNPKDPAAYARVSMIDYDVAEVMPRNTPQAVKLAFYEEMIDLSHQCLAIDPKQPECWHWLATGIGRRSTTKGVINSLMTVKDVEQAWLKAVAIKPTTVLPNGDRTDTNAQYGLTVFYRMVPDSWFIKMITGTRGDKKKAIAYMRAAVKTQPYRLELQKELGAALLCHGESDDDAASLAEGKQVLQAVIAGRFDQEDIRVTDPIDKRHSQELIDKPSLACGYSRDGYQDVDESKLKK